MKYNLNDLLAEIAESPQNTSAREMLNKIILELEQRFKLGKYFINIPKILGKTGYEISGEIDDE